MSTAAVPSSPAVLPALPVKELSPAAAEQDRSRYVFLAGAVAGTVEGIAVQPLEFLKTRLQINEGKPIPLTTALRDALREGGIRQLYRGGLPEISGMLPRSTAALSTLEFTKRALRSHAPGPDGKLQASHAYVAGAASGVAESVGFAPFQVIKVRMVAKEHLNLYRNSLDCAIQLVRNEGPQALLIGLGPTLWRVTIWNSLYYGTMHSLQEAWLDKQPLENPLLAAARKLGVGMAVGMAATCFNAPFDVVKSRFQAQNPGPDRKYRYTLPSLATIAREEGVRALYKGFLPKALRLGMGQTIGYMVFSECLEAFGAAQQK